ncbi:MAG: hypothetical protein ABW022_15820 [Actinoplanes sp.]
MSGNERQGLFAKLAAKRRAKHEDTYSPTELHQLKRKAWKLVHQSKVQKAAES